NRASGRRSRRRAGARTRALRPKERARPCGCARRIPALPRSSWYAWGTSTRRARIRIPPKGFGKYLSGRPAPRRQMRIAGVGARVMGAALADALHARGADVTLVEAVAPGAGTSSRGAGLLCEGLWHPASVRLVQRSMELLETISRAGEREGHPFRFHRVGSTTLVPEALAPAARKMAAAQRAWGADAREVAPEDVPALARHAGIDIEGAALAVHYPRDGWALPRLYAEVVARKLGDRVVRGAASLARDSEGRVVARVDGEPVRADAVAVACGVHTRALLREA